MKKSSAVLIILILPLLTTIAFLPTPTTVDGWGHSTHYFIVNEAVDNIGNTSWADAFTFYTEDLRSGSVAPDVLWQDWINHLYYPSNGNGSAPAAAAKWYDFARANFSTGNWEDGFFAAGVMSHYYADPCIPVHTDEWWPGHAGYETDINNKLGDLTLTSPSEVMVSNVSQMVVDNATYSNQYYDMIYDAYITEDDEHIATNSTIKALTEDCLSMALNGVLSLFYNLTLGLNAPDVAITYEHVAMIDFAHGNDYAPDDLTSVNQTLAIAGYELIEQYTAFNSSNLATVDLLIMTCAEDDYTAGELSAITSWYQSGGKSILITGRGDFDTYQDNLIMNTVLSAISSNIRINDDNVYMEGTYNPWYNDIYTIPDPADTLNMTFDVDSVSFFSPNSLYFLADDPILPIIYADVTAYQTDQNPPVPTVVYDDVIDGEWGDQIPLAAIEEIGTGRLFVAGTTFFSNFDHGDPVFENINMLENFLEWAVGNRSEDNIANVDEMGPRIGNVMWNPSSPDEGVGVNVSATVLDPSGIANVTLKYNNGSHDVMVNMTYDGANVYTVEIEDVTSGTLDILIESTDNAGNTATRAFFTITWTSTSTTTTTPTDTTDTSTTDTNTTTTSTDTGGGGTPITIDPMLLGIVGGVVVLLVVIVIVMKKR
ncbi:MAG: zinc dependent phospholipase C family protein [Candidatus Thorarchaeota archaeon]